MDMPAITDTVLGTRAVVRYVESGCYTPCAHCDERITFRAREKPRKVVCNIYEGDKWNRVEQYHFSCYELIDMPYGISGPLKPSFPNARKSVKNNLQTS